jgi:hypothetical protein
MTTHQRIVVTNCTTRKRASTSAVLLEKTQGIVGLEAVAAGWVRSLGEAPHAGIADNVYIGRAFSLAKAAAARLQASLYITSAGLGLVRGTDKVPNYNVTVSTGPGSLSSRFPEVEELAQKWWTALGALRFQSPFPLSEVIRGNRSAIVLVALPSSYMRMVVDDLARIDEQAIARTRIFTSSAGTSVIPKSLQQCVMPYDERLEGIKGHDGTRSDFPQRALRHFVEVLHGHELSPEQARVAVSSAMEVSRPRIVPKRERRSDEALESLIANEWARCQGSSAKLHRFLRDDALVACEQGRFRGLWRKVRDRRALTSDPTNDK